LVNRLTVVSISEFALDRHLDGCIVRITNYVVVPDGTLPAMNGRIDVWVCCALALIVW
jgi:hypothetical protein